MRISQGKYKGKVISSPHHAIKPTQGIIKKSIFDTIRPDIQEASVLDLFAGTGSIGLEALSCGAHHVTFVEHHRSIGHALKTLIRDWELTNTTLFIDAVENVLPNLVRQQKTFDVVFLDPPYSLHQLSPVVHLWPTLISLARGWLIIEEHHSALVPLPISPIKHRRFGDTQLLFYNLRGDK